MLQDRLIKKRKEKKMTQQELADKLHITRATYAQYEIGRRAPDYETLQKIADFFDVTIDFLIGRSDEEKPTPPNNELDNWGLSKEAHVFFKDFESLDEEGKQEAIKHLQYLKHLAEQKNKSDT